MAGAQLCNLGSSENNRGGAHFHLHVWLESDQNLRFVTLACRDGRLLWVRSFALALHGVALSSVPLPGHQRLPGILHRVA